MTLAEVPGPAEQILQQRPTAKLHTVAMRGIYSVHDPSRGNFRYCLLIRGLNDAGFR
jgi:hypothetical protein